MPKLLSCDESTSSFHFTCFCSSQTSAVSQYLSDFPETYVLTKSNEALCAGSRQASLWNIKPRKTSDPSPKRQPDSVIPRCILQPSSELFPGLPWLLTEMLFIQNICVLFQGTFMLNTWLSLCSHLIYPEYIHFSFQLHWSVLYMYKELCSFLLEFAGENFCPWEELGNTQ